MWFVLAQIAVEILFFEPFLAHKKDCSGYLEKAPKKKLNSFWS